MHPRAPSYHLRCPRRIAYVQIGLPKLPFCQSIAIRRHLCCAIQQPQRDQLCEDGQVCQADVLPCHIWGAAQPEPLHVLLPKMHHISATLWHQQFKQNRCLKLTAICSCTQSLQQPYINGTCKTCVAGRSNQTLPAMLPGRQLVALF